MSVVEFMALASSSSIAIALIIIKLINLLWLSTLQNQYTQQRYQLFNWFIMWWNVCIRNFHLSDVMSELRSILAIDQSVTHFFMVIYRWKEDSGDGEWMSMRNDYWVLSSLIWWEWRLRNSLGLWLTLCGSEWINLSHALYLIDSKDLIFLGI